ncbi:hypothetical protein KTH_10870 [Thermosporothrix hazakensis]|nr:hypothetical protein KTH_10870 [Thermosporothrix hazakensis]
MGPFFTSWAYQNLAQIAYEQNELAKAQHSLSQTLALRAEPEEGVHVFSSGALIHARLLHACGETQKAQEMPMQWEQSTHFSWPLSTIQVLLARLHLALGNLPAVEQWAQYAFGPQTSTQERSLPLLYQHKEALLLARLHIAQKLGEIALQVLTPWKEKAQGAGVTCWKFRCWKHWPMLPVRSRARPRPHFFRQ